MPRRRKSSSFSPRPAPKQLLPEELLGGCLAFLQRKFYPEHAAAFAKDRQRLLQWVVLWPAKWLDDRGVSITPARYREIFESVFMDGLRYGDLENITYLPAWLSKVIHSHFEHHGDEIYAEAKSLRTLAENALAVAGRALQKTAPDPVRELAQAARLLKPKKKPANPTRGPRQMDLL